jgi:hypothetical protein
MLIDAPWVLTISAGPIPAILDPRIDITQITWKVTPDWDQSLFKTVTLTNPINPPTAITSVQLPVPTGPVKTVTVEFSGTASTQGGTLNGVEIPQGPVDVGTDTQKVGYRGVGEHIAWLLRVQFTDDPSAGMTAVVVPILQAITP